MPRRSSRIRHRFGLGIADQILSSVTNFALGVFAAHVLDVPQFGAFALAFASYNLAIGASRAINSEPLTVRFSSVVDSAWRQGAAGAAGGALVTGIALGLVCVAVGLVAGGALAAALVPLGFALPGLLVQDCWRFAFFALGRGALAFRNDLAWAGVQVLAFSALILSDARSLAWIMAAWGGSALAAAALGCAQAGSLPAPLESIAWWRSQRDLAPRFLGEFAARNGSTAGTIYASAGIAGFAASAALRGGQILLGPASVLNMGITLAAVPEMVRLRSRSLHRLVRAAAVLSCAIAIPTLLWGSLMASLPASVGRALLGSSWDAGSQVVLPLAIGLAAAGVQTGPIAGLRALEDARRSLRARTFTGVLSLVGGVAGAYGGGAVGAASGLAGGLCIGTVVWWRLFLTAMQEKEDAESRAGGSQPLVPSVDEGVAS